MGPYYEYNQLLFPCSYPMSYRKTRIWDPNLGPLPDGSTLPYSACERDARRCSRLRGNLTRRLFRSSGNLRCWASCRLRMAMMCPNS